MFYPTNNYSGNPAHEAPSINAPLDSNNLVLNLLGNYSDAPLVKVEPNQGDIELVPKHLETIYEYIVIEIVNLTWVTNK